MTPSPTKYGAPLYGAAWPAGAHVLVAGGGGKASSGIPNRIIAVPVRATGLAPEAASLPLDAAPLRLALAPDGGAAAVALAGGAVARLDLETAPAAQNITLRAGSRSASTDGDSDGAGAKQKKKKEGSPSLSPGAAGRAAVGLAAAAVGVIPRVLFRARSSAGDGGAAHRPSGAGDAVAASSPAEVKALAFSQDGSTLAAGGDDGVVRLYTWPTLTPAGDLPVGGGGVRDVDWARDDCVAVALEDGSAAVWSVPGRKRLAALPPPSDLPGRASVARVRFDPTSGGRRLLAAVNAGGKGWVVVAEGDVSTPPSFSWTRRTALLPAPVTAFDVSRCGRLVGGGSADGDVAIADAATLARRGGARRAHMVFVTAVTFQRTGKAPAALPSLLSVSADASARVTRPRAAPLVSAAAVATLLVALLVAVLFIAELLASEPACQRGRASASLARCAAAGRARAGARADAAVEPLLALLRDVAIAAGVIGRFPGGDRGEL